MSSPQQKTDLPREEKEIVDSISSLGDKAKLVFSKRGRIKVACDLENLRTVARFVRDNLHFDHCANVTGTDFPKEKQLEITYHFGALETVPLRRIIFALSCKIPSNDPRIPSLIEEYPSVEFHEREEAEMLGVNFEGHPNLSRLLLPEDWSDIPPMLKAYRLPGRLESE